MDKQFLRGLPAKRPIPTGVAKWYIATQIVGGFVLSPSMSAHFFMRRKIYILIFSCDFLIFCACVHQKCFPNLIFFPLSPFFFFFWFFFSMLTNCRSVNSSQNVTSYDFQTCCVSRIWELPDTSHASHSKPGNKLEAVHLGDLLRLQTCQTDP